MALERRAPAAGAAGAERARPLVNRLTALATRADRQELSGRLEAEIAHQDALESVVVVAGEPNQGKTSLINALLAHEDLLPVDLHACTSAYIVVRHGPRSQARVTTEDGMAPLEIAAAELDQWVTAAGNPANAKRVRSVEITVDHPLLAGGLTLIDTPGVGGLDSAHGRTTLEALAFADALLFVSDASAPLSTAELAFLATACERIDTILFALSKVDQYGDWREILQADQAALELLDERAGTTHRAAPFVAVSSRAYLGSLLAGDDAGTVRRRRRSGIPDLEAQLSGRVGERAAALRLANLMRLSLTVAAELELVDNAVVSPSSEVRAQLAREDERLRALEDASAEWPRKLADAFYRLGTEITVERLAQLLHELELRYDAAVLRSYDGTPEEFAEQIRSELRALGAALDRHIRDGVARIEGEIAASISVAGMEVDGSELPEARSLDELDVLLAVRAELSDAGWARIGRLAFSAMSPGTATAVVFRFLGVGAPILIPIVLPVGIVFGAAMSRAEYKQLKRSEREVELRRILSDGIWQANQTLGPRASNHLLGLQRALEDGVQACIARRLAAVADSRRSLEAREQAGEDVRRGARQRLAELASLRKQIEELLRSALADSRVVSPAMEVV